MRSYRALLLVLALVASVFAQAQDSAPQADSDGQASGLQILEARAQAAKTSDSERARVFTIVVKNTGEKVIKSLGFAFETIDDVDTPETNKTLKPLTCGFTITDLDIQPDAEFTIKREMTGSHCIPKRSADQRVRVQEVFHSDGTTWRHFQYDGNGWQQVELVRATSSNP